MSATTPTRAQAAWQTAFGLTPPDDVADAAIAKVPTFDWKWSLGGTAVVIGLVLLSENSK